MHDQYVERVVDLTDPDQHRIRNMTVDEARARVARGSPADVRAIEGSFALVARDGRRVRLARSLDRPLRYFLAKQSAGPALVVSDRIDAIHEWLAPRGSRRPVPSELHAHGAGALRRRDRARRLPRSRRVVRPATSRLRPTPCRRTPTPSAGATSAPLADEIAAWLARRPAGSARRRLLLGRNRQRSRLPR